MNVSNFDIFSAISINQIPGTHFSVFAAADDVIQLQNITGPTETHHRTCVSDHQTSGCHLSDNYKRFKWQLLIKTQCQKKLPWVFQDQPAINKRDHRSIPWPRSSDHETSTCMICSGWVVLYPKALLEPLSFLLPSCWVNLKNNITIIIILTFNNNNYNK